MGQRFLAAVVFDGGLKLAGQLQRQAEALEEMGQLRPAGIAGQGEGDLQRAFVKVNRLEVGIAAEGGVARADEVAQRARLVGGGGEVVGQDGQQRAGIGVGRARIGAGHVGGLEHLGRGQVPGLALGAQERGVGGILNEAMAKRIG